MLNNPYSADLKAALADRAAGKDVDLAKIQRLQAWSDRWEKIDAQATARRDHQEAIRRVTHREDIERSKAHSKAVVQNEHQLNWLREARAALESCASEHARGTEMLSQAVRFAVKSEADAIADYLDVDLVDLIVELEDQPRASDEQLASIVKLIHQPWSDLARRDLVFVPSALAGPSSYGKPMAQFALHPTIRETLIHCLKLRRAFQASGIKRSDLFSRHCIVLGNGLEAPPIPPDAKPLAAKHKEALPAEPQTNPQQTEAPASPPERAESSFKPQADLQNQLGEVPVPLAKKLATYVLFVIALAGIMFLKEHLIKR